MPTPKRILVACGAALATSMVVSRKLEEELASRGIRVVTEQAKASEVAAAATNYDLIVTTASVSGVVDTPVVQTVSFLTGIGIERDVDEIVAKLSE